VVSFTATGSVIFGLLNQKTGFFPTLAEMFDALEESINSAGNVVLSTKEK